MLIPHLSTESFGQNEQVLAFSSHLSLKNLGGPIGPVPNLWEAQSVKRIWEKFGFFLF